MQYVTKVKAPPVRASMTPTLMIPLLCLLGVGSAFAGDANDGLKSGKILINQSIVAAAGGFPYKITKPGSYRLDGNLVGPLDTSAILIQSSDVVLDLSGFNIACSASQATIYNACILSGAGSAGPYSGITIQNGSVTLTASSPTAFGDQITGINLENSQSDIIENLHIDGQLLTNYSANAIISGSYSIIRNNTFFNAAPTLSCPSLVEGNVNQAPDAGSVGYGCTYVNNVGLFPQ